MFDLEQYLDRIDYTGPVAPTVETLRRLHYHHLMAVPFENLDIHYGHPIVLNIDRIYKKIVCDRRGGFCYELNGLFSELLRQLGFKAKIVSARVFENDKGEYSPEYDHLALLVDIDGTAWLTDVGFGEFIRTPLNIDSEAEQEDFNGVYRVKRGKNSYLVIEHKVSPEGWKPEYKFKPVERELAEFKNRCDFHQSSGESHFRRKKICSLPTGNGRITLTDDLLKIRDGENTNEQPVKNEEDFEELLAEYFAITIGQIRSLKLPPE